jgi:hypothetical protein
LETAGALGGALGVALGVAWGVAVGGAFDGVAVLTEPAPFGHLNCPF